MGSSTATYRGRAICAPDWILDVWLRLLATSAPAIARHRPDQRALGGVWLDQSAALGSGVVITTFAEHEDDAAQAFILAVAAEALARLERAGSELHVPTADVFCEAAHAAPFRTDWLIDLGEGFPRFIDGERPPAAGGAHNPSWRADRRQP